MQSLQPDAPIAASQPMQLTVTVDTPVDVYNPSTGQYEQKMIPQTIVNPTLDCHNHAPTVPLSIFFLSLVLTVFVTLMVRKWFMIYDK